MALDVAHLLEVARKQQRAGEQAERRRRARDHDRRHLAVGEQLQRDHGRDRAALDRQEARDHHEPARDQCQVALVEPDEQQPDAGGEQRDAGQVQRRAAALAAADRGGEDRRDHRERRGADGEVDREDRLPAHVVGEEAAHERAGDEADAHQARERALQRGGAAAGEEVGDEDEREAFQRARAEALERPVADQLLHVLRGGGQSGPEQEQDHADQEHRAAPVTVREPRVDRQRDRRGHQVGGRDPHVEVVAAQRLHDRRQRGADDRLVEHREQQAGHDRREEPAAASGGEVTGGGVHMSKCTCRSRHVKFVITLGSCPYATPSSGC